MGIRVPAQAEINTYLDQEKTRQADIEAQLDDLMKALALVLMDEINSLRAQHGLPPRTVQQLKNAIKSKL